MNESGHRPNTLAVLNKVAQEPIRLGIQETTDPEEILFVELITHGGMGITPAFMMATGKGNPEDATELRQYGTAALEMRTRPQVKVLLQRRLRETAANRMQDGELIRQRILAELNEIIDDPMQEPKVKLAAIDRLAKLTHVRAFDPPAARKEDEALKTSGDVLDRIRKLIKKEDQ